MKLIGDPSCILVILTKMRSLLADELLRALVDYLNLDLFSEKTLFGVLKVFSGLIPVTSWNLSKND